MNIEKVQDLTTELIGTNSNNDALINILQGYCENNLEHPYNGSLFDILVLLNQMKSNSNKAKNIIEQLNDCF